MTDIKNKDDIKLFVDTFYGKVRKDLTIGPVFAAAIPDENWGIHLKKMYGFWNTVLFRVREYSGSPFAKHAPLPIQKAHFERWMELFTETIDENFAGEKAEEAKMRADKMAQLFLSKLNYIRSQDQFKNIF